MSDAFMGEMRVFSFTFPPKGWAHCDGQVLPINQNQTLFTLLKTYYGGNGVTTFALPDLRDRVPIHVGPGYPLGQAGGAAAHTLTRSEMPQHTHTVAASSAASGGSAAPTSLYLGGAAGMYHRPHNLTTLHEETITSTGGSQPHSNLAPSLVLNFCISLTGVMPSAS